MSENEQMSIADLDYTYNRDGSARPADGLNPRRCENCIYWELLPKEDQPPAGWGVKGLCKFIHSDKQHGYQRTGQRSYCQEFKEYGKI